MSALALPVISSIDDGFFRYLQEVKKFPSLEAEEEYMLAKSYIEHEDVHSAHKLVTSHLKLVAKVAMSFRGYGLPMVELVSEGNIGLMQAVKKFNPELGFRLSTYAMWWIKAAMQEYVLRSWSLVKLGTTAAQKKLFFNLGKIKRRLLGLENGKTVENAAAEIASELDVTEKDVIDMNQRMSYGDVSLNSPIAFDQEGELIDALPESRPNQEVMLAVAQEADLKKKLFNQALAQLNEREHHIISERHLKEDPTTLEYLSQFYDISRERIRQIEAKALEKLRQYVMTNA